MQEVYQPISSLVEEITGTTRIISGLISRKAGGIALLVLMGVVLSRVLLV